MHIGDVSCLVFVLGMSALESLLRGDVEGLVNVEWRCGTAC